MALCFLLLGLLYPALEKSSGGRVLMLLLYGLTFFFANFGPNSTTFILPSETFPAHMRTTLNGFSAAMGKVIAAAAAAARTSPPHPPTPTPTHPLSDLPSHRATTSAAIEWPLAVVPRTHASAA